MIRDRKMEHSQNVSLVQYIKIKILFEIDSIEN